MIAIFSTVCIISDRPGSGVEDETGYPLVQWVCWPVVNASACGTLSQIFPIIKIHGKLEPKTAWRCNGFAPSPMSSGVYFLNDQRKEHGQSTAYLVSMRLSMPDNISHMMDLEGGCSLARIQLAVSCSCSLLASSASGIPPTLVERDPERCSLDPKSRVSKVFDAAFVVLCSAINCVVQQRHLMSWGLMIAIFLPCASFLIHLVPV